MQDLEPLKGNVLGELRQLSVAMRLYCDDNDGRMPSVGTYMNSGNSNEMDWCGCQLVNPVGNPVHPEQGTLYPYVRNKKLYLCPTDIDRPAKHAHNNRNYALSYSMNWFLHHYRLDRVAQRDNAKVLLFTHETRDTINDGLLLWNQPENDDMPSNAHYKGTTASYVDLHVRWLPYDELVRQRSSGEWRCYPGQRNPS